MVITAQISAAYEPLADDFKAVSDAQRRMQQRQAAAPPAPAMQALQEAAAAAAAAALATAQARPGCRRIDGLMALLAANGIELDGANVVITNTAPDEGLSAPFNSWFTLFGQFFDHGLDLVDKGGNGTVFIPLMPDDPLYRIRRRAPTELHGADARHTWRGLAPILATIRRHGVNEAATHDRPVNTTTSFVDQNQTYTSHPSHQVFLRQYELNADWRPVATGKLIEGGNGGMATWAELKAQARDMLGIQLLDANVGNVPLLATDQYGNFIPGSVDGFAQVIIGGLSERDPDSAMPTDDVVDLRTPMRSGTWRRDPHRPCVPR